jgi:hypothetical protein
MHTLLAVYDDGLSSRSTVPVRNGGIVTCMGVETDKLEGYYVTDGPWLPQAFPYREAQIIRRCLTSAIKQSSRKLPTLPITMAALDIKF